ncbi:MAG: hypothetical protein OHK0046_08090 [Anaerolineae bacterium]
MSNDIRPYEEQPEDDSSALNSEGCRRALLIIGGCASILVVVLLVVILGAVAVGVTTFNAVFGGFGDAFSGIFEGEPATATVTTSATIVTNVQPLGQLVSFSSQLAKADITVTVRSGPILDSCTRTANHVAQGTIEAGVDLTQLEEDDVTYNELNNSYTIRLPTPQITSCRIDFLNQYNRSTSLCGPSWENIRLLGNYVALTEFRNDAIEGGILERARDEAETVLSNFLQLSTGRTVNIEFQNTSDGQPIFPASCEPPTPGTWRYDEASGTWQEQ